MNLTDFHCELTNLLVLTSKTQSALIDARKLSIDAEKKYRLSCYDYINRMFSVFESTHGPVEESYKVLIQLIGNNISPAIMSTMQKHQEIKEQLKNRPSNHDLSLKFKEMKQIKSKKEITYKKHVSKVSWIDENADNIKALADLEASQDEINNPTLGFVNRLFNGRNKKLFTASTALNKAWIDESSPFLSEDNNTFNLLEVTVIANNHNDISREYQLWSTICEHELRDLVKEVQLTRELECQLAQLQSNKAGFRTKIIDYIYGTQDHEPIEMLLGKSIASQYNKYRGHSRTIQNHKDFFEKSLVEINDSQLKLTSTLSSLDLRYGELELLKAHYQKEEMEEAKRKLDKLREAAMKYIDALWYIKSNEIEIDDSFTARDIIDLLTNNLNELGYDFSIDNYSIYNKLSGIDYAIRDLISTP